MNATLQTVLWRRENRDRPRGGSTLVELLMVIAIICTMTGLVLGGLNSARATAREAQTKTTITKLHNIIMTKYNSYRTRRVTMTCATGGMTWRQLAQARLKALRDLMRMEMPERYTDISRNASASDPPTSGIAVPAITKAYRARCGLDGGSEKPLDNNASAKCLYMIVTMACGAREQFKEHEIADLDKDGFRVFVDGWRNPIYFLRWAPGFSDSDIQPNVNGTASAKMDADLRDHDPFDPRKVDSPAWRLEPLIYSAGPDGVYGLQRDTKKTDPPYEWANDTYSQTWGAPTTDTETARYDNIHNHRIEAK